VLGNVFGYKGDMLVGAYQDGNAAGINAVVAELFYGVCQLVER